MKSAKITLLALAAVVVAAVLSIGVPVPLLAGAIAKRFEAATGYRLTTGTPSIRLLPSPAMTLGKITVLDIGEAGLKPRLTAERVRIEASLSNLFSGKPVVKEIALTRPVLRAPLLRERSARRSAPTAVPGLNLPEGLVIERLTVEDGAVKFTDQSGRVENQVKGIAVTGSLAADRTFDVSTSIRLGEQILRVAFNGKLPDGRNGGGAPFTFKIEAPGLLQDAATGTADLRTTGSVLAINSLSGTIAQSNFSGWISVDFADKPLVKMDLDFQKLSLAAVKPEADPTGGLDRPWSDKSFNLDGLNYVDAEMQISAAEFSIDRFRFAPITISAILTNGVLSAGVTNTGAYAGQVQGTLAVDASNAEPSHALRLDLIGVQALPLLTDVASFTTIDGRMQARIDVRGRGSSVRAIMSSLGGAADLSVKDGEIRSVNIAKMIRAVGASIVSGWQKDTTEKTDLTELSAFFRIESGQASTDNFKLLGPLVRVTGTGTIDLGGKTLQLRVEPKLVLSLEGQGGAPDSIGFGVPVAVQGPWGAPSIYPDVAGILDNPDGAYATLKELKEGLFGPGQSGSSNPIMQGIESLLGHFSGKGGSSQTQQQGQAPAQDAPVKLPDLSK